MSMYISHSSNGFCFTTISLICSREIFYTALAIYPIMLSKIISREPPPVAELGPPPVKKLGKLGLTMER
jgi:hypothetical protein